MNATTAAEIPLPPEKEEPARHIETSPALLPTVSGPKDTTAAVSAQTATISVNCQDPENPQPTPVVVETDEDRLIARIAHTRFDPGNKPPEEACIFSLTGVEIAHAGNLVTVAAAVKSGKSSVIAAMIASLMGEADGDYLAFSGSNPDGKAVLHFDTEQSRGDHWLMGMRTLRRAGLEAPPSWFQSYSLILLGPEERGAVIGAMARQSVASGGLHSIFIDGVADLVLDVNDLEEACGLVTELHQLANETGCVIVSAIHHNPGGEKTRGHLGSQIERKSESVLVLRKEGELVSIDCKPARRQEISGDKAPRFSWDPHAGMHKLSQIRAVTANDRKREELGILADEVFGEKSLLSWTELNQAIMAARGWSKNTAGNKIIAMVKLEVIKKAIFGSYERCPQDHTIPTVTPN